MKKNYFMLAAAALMFAACAETDFVNPVPVNEGEAIGFDTYAQLPTRAATETENNQGEYTGTLQSIHETFSVWANKLVNTTYTAVYTDQTVSWTGDPKAWTPATKAYWDKTASNYYFYAAAPADFNWEYAEKSNGSTGFLKLTNHELNGTTATEGKTTDKDLLIAAECVVPQTSYLETPATVGLQFIHILSKLNINVKKSSDATIKLNGITVSNLMTKATFNEGSADANNVSGSYARWANDGTTKKDYLSKSVNPLSSTSELVLEGFVIPQNAAYTAGIKTDGSNLNANPYIKIDYTIGAEDFVVYYNLADVFNGTTSNDIAFNEGWQNTLTITISPLDIKFSGAVSTWSEGAGSGSGSGLDIN